MKYPWKNKREKEDIMHSIAVSVAEIAEASDFATSYAFRIKALREMKKMSNDELIRFYRGYQLMNQVIREYCDEKNIAIYEFKNPAYRI